jgi:hypothetical protein
MKILYLSCHATLEYDELKLFEEMGYDYFSIGAYINPKQPHDPKRPALNGEYKEEFASLLMAHNQSNLHPHHIEWADVIIVMHIPEWIESNWPLFKQAIDSGKRVIWRTIGQSVQGVEERLAQYRKQGLEVVRYSPAEANIPGYIGSSGLIRFYKDPEEFKEWNGQTKEVVTFAQSMKQRAEFCNFDAFQKDVQGLDAHVYGPNNDGELNGGLLSYDALKAKMRDAGVYYYTGTHPASYTLNFMEAWMTGIPIVAIGHKLGNSQHFAGQLYEVPDLIQNGYNGFVSDVPEERQKHIRELLNNPDLAKNISANARKSAIETFGKETIKRQWREYLEQ